MEWNVNLDSKSSAHVRNTGVGVYLGYDCDPSVTVCRGTQVTLTEYTRRVCAVQGFWRQGYLSKSPPAFQVFLAG